MSFKSLVKLIPLSVVIFVSCVSRSVVEKPSPYASKEKTKPPMEKPSQRNGKSANSKEIQPERIVQTFKGHLEIKTYQKEVFKILDLYTVFEGYCQNETYGTRRR